MASLPADVWALVLSNFCTYEDVRSCLAVNKMLWNDVPPLIERLYVCKAGELDSGYASKFVNLTHAYVYSLMSIISTNDSDSDDSSASSFVPETSLCLDTARDVVPFLECFEKLDVVYVGGYTPGQQTERLTLDNTHLDLPYTMRNCRTEGHQDAFRRMLDYFCDAFERRSLDANLVITGIFDDGDPFSQMECPVVSSSRENNCRLCPRICQAFPLPFVSSPKFQLNVCLDDQKRLTIIHGRDNTFLKSSGMLVRELTRCDYGSVRIVLPAKRTNYGWQLREAFRMAIQIRESTFKRIDFLCKSCGCDPSVEDLEYFARLNNYYTKTANLRNVCKFECERNYMSRELYDRIVRTGFQLRESDVILIIPYPDNEDYWILDPCEKNRWTDADFDGIGM